MSIQRFSIFGRFQFREELRNFKNSNPKLPKNVLGGFGFGMAVFERFWAVNQKVKYVFDFELYLKRKIVARNIYTKYFVHKLENILSKGL